MTKKYNLYIKNISTVSQSTIGKLAQKLGFVDANILNIWPHIATDIFHIAKPIKMRYDFKANEYLITLLIRDLSLWAQWTMVEKSLIMKAENILNKKCKFKVKIQT